MTKNKHDEEFYSALDGLGLEDEVKETIKGLVAKRLEPVISTFNVLRGEVDDYKKKLSQVEQKHVFLESATSQGCVNPKVAYAVANADSLYKEDNTPDWDRIKETVPELFKQPDPKTQAGVGTQAATKVDINTRIREAANRK